MSLTDDRIEQIITAHGGNFTVDEFGGDRHNLTPKLVRNEVLFRNWHGYSTQLTSIWRNTGSHQFGTAVGKLIWSDWRSQQPDPMELWRLATMWPWTGVGIYFDWNDGIGLHTDLITHQQALQMDERQRPLRWLRTDGNYYYQDRNTGRFYNQQHGVTSLESEVQKYKGNEK